MLCVAICLGVSRSSRPNLKRTNQMSMEEIELAKVLGPMVTRVLYLLLNAFKKKRDRTEIKCKSSVNGTKRFQIITRAVAYIVLGS